MKPIITNTLTAAALLFAGQAGAVDEAAAKALAKRYGCFNCHSITNVLVGPPWQEVGAKYAKEKGALERLAKKVPKDGSKGIWGENEMPPQTRVTEDDARILIEYILTLHP